jgi:hypothetical protein
VIALPPLDDLNWSKIRALAKDLAAQGTVEEVVETALPLLDAPGVPHRQLAVYLLGFTAGQRPDNVAALRERVPSDPNWEVQEALAQAKQPTPTI